MCLMSEESGWRKLEEEEREDDDLGSHLKLLLFSAVLMRFGIIGLWIYSIENGLYGLCLQLIFVACLFSVIT